MLGDCLLHWICYEEKSVGGELCIIFGEGYQRLEEGLVLVDCIMLHEFFVLFYDFAHKGFHWLQEILASHSHILQVLP